MNLIPSERPSGALVWARFGGDACEESGRGGEEWGPDPLRGSCPRGGRGGRTAGTGASPPLQCPTVPLEAGSSCGQGSPVHRG